jgi:hypothetical protein
MCGMARRMKIKTIMRSRLPLRVAVSVLSYVGTPVNGTLAESLAYSSISVGNPLKAGRDIQ